MARYAAFLRAVNLGANRKTPSDRLRAAFERAGLEDVATFRTSGNVVFSAGGAGGSAGAAKLVETIERGLVEEFGFEVPVFLRTEAQVKAIAGHRPFPPKVVDASEGKLQVVLLAAKPTAAAEKRALALATDHDLLAQKGTELYWLPSEGTQQSPLGMKPIERALGLNTVRTMGTIEKIAEKLVRFVANG